MKMNIVNVVDELSKDYVATHELMVDAQNAGDLNRAEKLLMDLIEINDLYQTIFKDEINRDVRKAANAIWRIATSQQ